MQQRIPYLPLILALLLSLPLVAAAQPKREFRGAWLQTVYQGQYSQMNDEECQAYLRAQLDSLQWIGINAVIFQVRPQADAFYPSRIEPWSRFMSGEQGVAPSPLWNPLAFLVEECHARNMELHAWINPYRVTASVGEKLSKGHIYHQHPEWFVRYNKRIYFDPGIPQSRHHICKVVRQLVSHYDIDAIHLDDYFYPYPTAGAFPDDASFKHYGMEQQGYKRNQRADWRRENVNTLIEELDRTIAEVKPWVRLGISPFGIYRNKRSDPNGSETNGTQTYDDLYADVMLWAEQGWIDYLIPQLYWELDHPIASSRTLVKWWGEHTPHCHLYIGQDVRRTLDVANPNEELIEKMLLSRLSERITGNCFWSGYNLIENYKNIANVLHNNYFDRPALLPAYTHIDATPPHEVMAIRVKEGLYSRDIVWRRRFTLDKMQHQLYFAIYRFEEGERIELNADHLVGTTRACRWELPPSTQHNTPYTYVITALDRAHNESAKGRRIEIIE